MSNFSIEFSRPWFLLFLILALVLTLIPYFRMNKRYRKTRNRITSIVLHLIIMLLSVSVLAGMTFEYDIPNKESEVIILVDVSDSGEKTREEKDTFVKGIIDNTDSLFKIGIVTFGFDQVYAVELTNDTDSIYGQYLQSLQPDTTASDISAALTYAAGLFQNPQTGRIVLISDALETDGEATKVIKTIAATGIKVDTMYFPTNDDIGDEVQIIAMSEPEEKLAVGETFQVEVTLQSSFEGTATVVPYDNNAEGEAIPVELKEGLQTVTVPFTFRVPGLHKLSFELASDADTISQNNVFNSYLYVEIFDKILVVESIDKESASLCDMLRDELNVDIVNVNDVTAMPTTLDGLRAYDEVILCNIANSDLPQGFDQLLYSYVHDIGGGLFTICGNKEDSDPSDDYFTANAYTREDMYGTLYQEMLPVEAINYTPPTAVMIIIDRSGSMFSPTSSVPEENSKLGYAKQGAIACLDVLTERDYVGVMSLSENYEQAIELTPRPQRDKILAAIDSIQGGGGGTIFSDAIMRAGQELSALSSVERKHIIIVTDGEPSGNDEDNYIYWLKENAKLGITTSVVGIQCTPAAKAKMIDLLTNYAGASAKSFYDVNDIQKVPEVMRGDLEAPEIKDVNYVTFRPEIKIVNKITEGIPKDAIPTLDGFYGVKPKEGAQVILTGEYTPIYTQWQFGKGMVGTFACDLNGTWSKDFISSDQGDMIINNIIKALFPMENIQPVDMELEAIGKNYKTNLSVFTDIAEDDTVEITVKSLAVNSENADQIQTLTASVNNGYSKLQFAIKTPGVYEIHAVKKNAEGTVISEATIYKALPYSQEYNAFTDPVLAEALMEQLAADSNGEVLEEPWDVFMNVVKYLHRVIDPKIAFMIIAVTLFLLDIAVRKFKWKWPHEIIRDRKIRIAMENARKTGGT